MAGDNISQRLSSGGCGGCCNKSRVIQIIFFLIWTAIGIAFIIVGALNLNNCPAQRYIPIYMIVAGAFSFSYWILLPLECCLPMLRKILGILIGLFMFAWFIAGSVWVFQIYANTDRDANCNRGMYLFAFSILIIQYIFIALGIIGSLISCFCCENSCFSKFFNCSEICGEGCGAGCGDLCGEGCGCLKICSCLQCCCKSVQCSKCLDCSKCFSCCQCCCAVKA